MYYTTNKCICQNKFAIYFDICYNLIGYKGMPLPTKEDLTLIVI